MWTMQRERPPLHFGMSEVCASSLCQMSSEPGLKAWTNNNITEYLDYHSKGSWIGLMTGASVKDTSCMDKADILSMQSGMLSS